MGVDILEGLFELFYQGFCNVFAIQGVTACSDNCNYAGCIEIGFAPVKKQGRGIVTMQ